MLRRMNPLGCNTQTFMTAMSNPSFIKIFLTSNSDTIYHTNNHYNHSFLWADKLLPILAVIDEYVEIDCSRHKYILKAADIY
jgi:hypothetical protein